MPIRLAFSLIIIAKRCRRDRREHSSQASMDMHFCDRGSHRSSNPVDSDTPDEPSAGSSHMRGQTNVPQAFMHIPEIRERSATSISQRDLQAIRGARKIGSTVR